MSEYTNAAQVAGALADAMRSQRVLNLLGLAAVRIIRTRTRAGKGVDGASFRPYSRSWAARRRRAGLPVSPVNLEFDLYAGMMSKVDYVVGRDLTNVALLIADPEKARIASYHNDTGAGRSRVIRRFWGFSDEETQKMADLVGGEVAKLLSTQSLPTGDA